MGGLWRNNPETPEGKYLVLRRDGSVPEWSWFVLGARDPAAPTALRAYADTAEKLGYDPMYVQDCRDLADLFDAERKKQGEGDPDGVRHRKDCQAVVTLMRVLGRSA